MPKNLCTNNESCPLPFLLKAEPLKLKTQYHTFIWFDSYATNCDLSVVRLSRKNGWGKKGGGEKEKNFSPAEPAKYLKNKILNNKSQNFPPKFWFREIPHF